MAEHTPPPWRVGAYGQVISENRRVADCRVAGMGLHEGNANARLIAAAPDLLAALELVMREEVLSCGVEMTVSNAIAKAKGETL